MHAVQHPQIRDPGQSFDTLTEQFAVSVIYGGVGALCGCLGSHFVTAVSPLAGAIFGAAAGASEPTYSSVFDHLFGTSTREKTARVVLGFLTSISIGMLATSLAGFSFPLPALVTLGCSSIAIFTLFSCIVMAGGAP